MDLVGPLPRATRGNQRILVLTGHFIRWQYAIIARPDATAPNMATILDKRVVRYFGSPERIHFDLKRQFKSKLMAESCALWRVNKTHTTPYHRQSNGVIERGNRVLGDAQQAVRLDRGKANWDLVLPQFFRAFRGTPNLALRKLPAYWCWYWLGVASPRSAHR